MTHDPTTSTSTSASVSTKTLDADAAHDLLKARARELAVAPRRQQTSDEELVVIEFRLAQERYAVEQCHAREITPLKDLTLLPCTPAFVAGIINLRGQIVPVIDIKKFFDMPDAGITDLHTVIVVHAGGVELGILADSVVGVRAVPLRAIQPSLPTLTGLRASYLRGVTDEHVVILNVPGILEDPKIIVDEEVGG